MVRTTRIAPILLVSLRTGIFLLTVGAATLSAPPLTSAATCNDVVGKLAWFIGSEGTVPSDGTFVQQSGNAGNWDCTDPARGRVTFRWRDGGFVNSVALSPDGQSLTCTDQSQSYHDAKINPCKQASASRRGELLLGRVWL